MCHLQVTYWFFSHGNIWIQLHLVKLLVGFQIIIIILVFITVSHIHGKTAIKISIPSTSTTTSYTQENLRVFFFFFSWTVTQMWALEDQSFIFLTFDVLFKPLPCLSWCFNFTLKFSTVFCMCMWVFIAYRICSSLRGCDDSWMLECVCIFTCKCPEPCANLFFSL